MQGAESRVCLPCLGGIKIMNVPVNIVKPIADVLKRYWAFTYQQSILCILDEEDSNFISVLKDAGFLVDCIPIKDFYALTVYDVLEYDYLVGNCNNSFNSKFFLKFIELAKPFAMFTDVRLRTDLNYVKLIANNKAEQLFVYVDDEGGNSSYGGTYICKNLFRDVLNMAEVK